MARATSWAFCAFSSAFFLVAISWLSLLANALSNSIFAWASSRCFCISCAVFCAVKDFAYSCCALSKACFFSLARVNSLAARASSYSRCAISSSLCFCVSSAVFCAISALLYSCFALSNAWRFFLAICDSFDLIALSNSS